MGGYYGREFVFASNSYITMKLENVSIRVSAALATQSATDAAAMMSAEQTRQATILSFSYHPFIRESTS